MVIQQILVLHPVRSTRKRLKSRIYSELDDVFVTDVASLEEALDLMGSYRFSMALAARETDDWNAQAVKEEMNMLPLNHTTPMIALVEPGEIEEEGDLQEGGIARCLHLPPTPESVREALDQKWGTRSAQSRTRIQIPKTTAHLQVQDHEVTLQVIHISATGVLCEMSLQKEIPDRVTEYLLTLDFPPPFQAVGLNPLPCRLLNFIRVKSPDAADRCRLTFLFSELSDHDRGDLAKVLGKAEALLAGTGFVISDGG